MAVFGAGALGGPAFADTVRVGPGDTLTAIAALHHTTVAALAAANGIADPNRLMIGTVLQVPGAPSVPSAATVPSSAGVTTTVVVRAGDTLTSIASRNHITVAALVKANNIANPNFVLIGTRLQVPNGLAPLPSGSAPADAVTAKLLAHPERLALRTDFVRAAAASGLAPNLLEAMCWWESGWQNSATSSTGAMGVCQLEPSTVGYARTKLLHNTALDPRVGPDNIAMAAAYLHDLVGRSGGDVSTALAGYYQGLPSVQRGGLLTSTQAYVKGILGYAAIFPSTG
jgi:LysM repeat protein